MFTQKTFTNRTVRLGVVRWWTGPWQHCSVTCGDQGTRKRTVLCVRQLGPDQQIALEDWQCEDLDRPSAMSACRRQLPCPPDQGQWRTGPWTDVSLFAKTSCAALSLRERVINKNPSRLQRQVHSRITSDLSTTHAIAECF